jgi:D-galactarolactone cycloisomerase
MEMAMDRRQFLATGGAAFAATHIAQAGASSQAATVDRAALRRIGAAPVLRRDLLADAAIVQSVDLLRIGKQWALRVRDDQGGEGVALCNPSRIRSVWPILLDRVVPTFVGKDARDLHSLQDAMMLRQLNYKWAGLPFWVCAAWMELALLDLLGRRSGRSVAELVGPVVRRDVGLYHASGDRTSSAEAVVDELRGFMAETGTRAVKFRLGARLSTTPFSDARDARLIPLARKALGDDAILYADANSSYELPQAIATGRLLQAHGYAAYEEPVAFDDMDEMKAVADALTIPLGGGEQESSLRRFEAMIARRVVDIVQPDILYFGGLTRAIRVARMAQAAGLNAAPHISGGGLGFLYMLQFAAVVPNTTDYQEYKGADAAPYVVAGTDRPLTPVGGRFAIPQGPGLGIRLDPDWLARGEKVTL